MTINIFAVRCREKTAARNVYRAKRFAKRIASKMRRETGCKEIHWFRCRECGLYHVGKR